MNVPEGVIMALYTVCSMMRRVQGKKKSINQYMQVVVTSGPESEEVARQIFRDSFQLSEYAAAGWSLVGEPMIVELHQGHLAEWHKWISPAPTPIVIKPTRDHLRVVRE
jgi:hypothetical protein